METIGKFEFNRKDLIGHGAFAVVFRGRHKEKRDWVVAVKCINKKNLAKSQSLLGKEIKILKELKHENIVRLLDYQEMGGCVYLVMEYCNGGDLAEYLHSKGTLSEDTIRVFLHQIGQAMKVLQSKGILHRDLKPQNILLCHPEGRRSSPNNTCLKIDKHYGSHAVWLSHAPEVIMSQNYDAKADLWSIGTIVYQCLTGKAPFHASTPQELRQFYESNSTLLPRGATKNESALMSFFTILSWRSAHPQKNVLQLLPCFHFPAQARPVPLTAPPHPIRPPLNAVFTFTGHPGFLKEIANHDTKNTSCYTEDYVMVPAQYPSDCICELEVGSPIESCLIYRVYHLLREMQERHLPPLPAAVSLQAHWCPFLSHHKSTTTTVWSRTCNLLACMAPPGTATLCCADSDSPESGGCRAPSPRFTFNTPRLATRGAFTQQSSPLAGMMPKTLEQTLPLSTNTGLQDPPSPKVKSRLPSRRMTVHDLQTPDSSPVLQTNLSRKSANKGSLFKSSERSLSTARLSDMLLKAAFGAHLFEEGSTESLNAEKSMDVTAPPSGCQRDFPGSDSPPPVVFTMGSPSRGGTPDNTLSRMFSGSPSYINSAMLLNSRLLLGGSRRNSETEAMDASLVFHPPELPEDTLMEPTHTDALSDLRFTLAFVVCVMELASSKDSGVDATSNPDVSFLEQSLVTDQISLLSKEWSYAEQLVLYMKAEEFLSSALHTAKETIKQGELVPSATVKQVIKKLNELYKSCVTYCRNLNHRLQTFLLDKQKLMDRFNGLTAEKLIYSHTVHMVQSAALDEMFQYGTASVQRYQRALLLMEGLSRIITEQKDIDSIDKCMWQNFDTQITIWSFKC
ncbi:hypothetical protein F7725_012801 [Dissostichus mawsoni]|uniref:non-specific serine/threonine protein kinase n=1 Tax=Dissostichus mawsoni TaxID=36200 RepID=A0A7J5YQL9_DISMA|nr:hypothetical protein F7725_012801 [Dissostichus mawsoni]